MKETESRLRILKSPGWENRRSWLFTLADLDDFHRALEERKTDAKR
jgi:hypothetical protein